MDDKRNMLLDGGARRTWKAKCQDAFRGAKRAARGEANFAVHLFFAAIVIAGAAALELGIVEWCLLILCISAVLSAEMFNTALEWLAKSITSEHDPRVGTALDIASAAVLIAAFGATLVGMTIFLHGLGGLIGWW